MTAPARITQADVDRPFTVPALAKRWGCSEGLIRKMIERGELSSFRLGVLIRVPASEVAKIECPTASNDSDADLQSSGARTESDEGERSTPKIGRARKPRPDASGKQATIHRGPWDA